MPVALTGEVRWGPVAVRAAGAVSVDDPRTDVLTGTAVGTGTTFPVRELGLQLGEQVAFGAVEQQ